MVRAFPLGSQQDCNFLLQGDGGWAGVLKIANPAFSRTEIEAQDAAAGLVAGVGGLRAGTALHGPVTVHGRRPGARPGAALPAGGHADRGGVSGAAGGGGARGGGRAGEPGAARLLPPRARPGAAVGPAARRPRGPGARGARPGSGPAGPGDRRGGRGLAPGRAAGRGAAVAGGARRRDRQQRRLLGHGRAADPGRGDRLRGPDQLVGGRRARRRDHLGAAARRGRAVLGAARGTRVRCRSGRCPPRRRRRCGRWSCCAPRCWSSAASSRPPWTAGTST